MNGKCEQDLRDRKCISIYWVVQKVIAFFPIDGVATFICMRAWHECQIFTRILLLTLNLKTKKKLMRFDRVLCLQLWFEFGEFWREFYILYSPYSVLLLQKREESNWSKGKVASSLRQKCRQKTPVPELVRPIPWFFSQKRSSLR